MIRRRSLRAQARRSAYASSMQDSTLSTVEQARSGGVRMWTSRAALALILGLVLAALLGLLGVHTATVRASGGGYSLQMEYPRTARAGLDVTWRVTVQRTGGFDKTLELAVSADQFDIYETQGFYPVPDSMTRDADTVTMMFIPPPGDTFVLTFDAYVQPSSQVGRDATLSVLEHGTPAATVAFSTWLAP